MLYASKDSEYPTRSGDKRRINWGWARVPPQSTQTLPRAITFNAAARTLEQAPIPELEALRGPAVASNANVLLTPGASVDLKVGSGVAKHSETIVTFALPESNATFGVDVGGLRCAVSYAPQAADDSRQQWVEAEVACGTVKDMLRLLRRESTIEVHVFA